MKKLLFLFFTTSSLLFIEIGCSREDALPLTTPHTETHTEANVQSDSVLIGISPIFNISSEPMSTRASNNDLYAVEVSKQIYYTNELGYDWIGTITYACGYFDDLSKAVIKLAKRDKYGVTVNTMVGFLDGINDSLKEANPIETMEEDTVVSLAFDTEKLYKNMVAAGADWLYGLPEWEAIYDEDTRKALYKEQKRSTTVVNEEAKVYPNDPCPCGSGKKYKKCCGRN